MDKQSPTSKKRPFKLFEHSLRQFNDVVIPHRLDMMGKHKGNIIKAVHSGDFPSATKEQTAARMLVQNLKRDLNEIEALRNQVDVHDLVQFDKGIDSSRKKALAALEEYIDLGKTLSSERQTRPQLQSSNHIISSDFEGVPQLQISLDADEEYVRSWEKLRDDVESLQIIFADLHQMASEQGVKVDNIEVNVVNTAEDVRQGNLNLKQALKYKGAMYPVVGAAVGTLIFGPVGLVVGLKAGGCAAIGGGIVGFVGGKLLKKANNKIADTDTDPVPIVNETLSSKPHQN